MGEFLWPLLWALLWALCALLVALVVLAAASRWSGGALQYRCKMLLYSSCMVLVAFYMLPACFYRGKNVINLRIASRLGRHTKWLIGVTYRALGGERMGGSGACVIVSNHQSSLDFLGMMEFLPERGVLVAKREIMLYTGPFGLASYLCGTLFIDRRDPDRAKEAVAKFAHSLLPQDLRLWMFPEGTRNHGNDLLPFKRGAFHLAVQGQVPIVPAVFSNYSSFYSKEKQIFKPGTITLTVLPPISTEGLGASDVGPLADRVRDAMMDVLRAQAGKSKED
ncbi:1-acyl-sn-glycerol-3-phosphate acyltransferase alpha-like [Lampetra fluviatilis]